MNIQLARKKLKADGWTYRTAAPVLGCSLSWLGRVLSGKIKSRRLLGSIEALPPHTEWRQANEPQS
jgi:hypothetical protein